MNVLSLFDGMSCGQLALQRAGIAYERYFASEIDRYAVTIARKNFPKTIHIGNVEKVRFKNGWLHCESGEYHVGAIDLLLGGSPCQGFSNAGAGLNFDDPRSKLFFEYVRLLNEIRAENPDVKFLLENVRMKKEWQDIISHLLKSPDAVAINSALLSPQNRIRLYWTNIDGLKQPRDAGIFLKDIVEESFEEKYIISQAAVRKILRRKHFVAKLSPEKTGCLLPKNNSGQLGITAGTTLLRVDGKPKKKIEAGGLYRRLMPIECERLQTVPENYTEGVSDTQRYKMLGNGWTVDVIAHVFKNIAPGVLKIAA